MNLRISVLFLLGSTISVPALMGGVFTSTSGGTQVPGNIYALREDVYVNGGPQTSNTGALPDGIYEFRVTEPDGVVLLSTDPAVCRQLKVFQRVSGPNRDADAACIAAGGTPHPAGTFNPATNSTPVQLFPLNFTSDPGGEYRVWLVPQGCATPGCAKTDTFKVLARPCDPNCENPQAMISGAKYYDQNTNGIRDLIPTPEPGIAGFRIDVTVTPPGGSPTLVTTFTQGTGVGQWSLLLDRGTTFRACEVLPATGGWRQTGPIVGATVSVLGTPVATADAARCWTGTVGTQDIGGLDFGNVCLGAGGGLSLGFWSNTHGQSVLAANPGWQSLLNGLNLRNAAGDNFDVSTYASFRTWLLGATAVNMSYMLSVQLAAMELNVAYPNRFGGVNGASNIFAGPNPAGCSVPVNQGGFITVNNMMGDANRELGLDGLTPAGDPERVCQEFKKNALDAANNNRNFARPTPCTPIY